MQLILTSSAILILVIGIYLGNSTRQQSNTENITNDAYVQDVLSTTDQTSEENIIESPTPEISIKEDVSSNIVIDTNVESENSEKNDNSSTPFTLSEFRYMPSELVTESPKSLHLKSSDSTDVITTWYKNKINSLGMSVTSFVTTQSNETIKNKLSGADNSLEITIEINKVSANQDVDIEVELGS